MDKFGHDELYICGEEEKKKKSANRHFHLVLLVAILGCLLSQQGETIIRLHRSVCPLTQPALVQGPFSISEVHVI